MPAALDPAIMATHSAADRCTIWARPPVAAAALITFSIARRSATGGRDATNEPKSRPDAGLTSAASSACTISSASMAASSPSTDRRSVGSSGGNSGTPESIRKHLNPITPAWCRGSSASWFPGTAPPQNATSTQHFPAAAARLSASAATDTVGGSEFSGMSPPVVTPPAAAARVAVTNPSHSARPGSLTCTWVSTRPGSSARSPRSTSRPASSASPYPATVAMADPLTATAAGRVPSGSTVRRDRSTRSYLIGCRSPPAEARRAVRRIGRRVLAPDPARIALRGKLPEQRLEIQLAGPRSAAVRYVRDLDMRDVARAAGQRPGQVLAHPAQVVHVGEERDVGDAPGTHRADHRQRALAGHDRGTRAVVGVQRFHHDRGSGAGGDPRGPAEVLRGHFLLLLLGHAVGPVPVQRVEDPAAGPLGDAGADVDVVPERGRTRRERQQPSLAGRYVTRDDVQQDQPYAGV